MSIFVICVVVSSILNAVISGEVTRGTHCNLFNPTCGDDEVILMVDALYGRMDYGKCIERNEENLSYENLPKHFRCSRNVLKFLHEKCSLQKQCNVSMKDISTHPDVCALVGYLESKHQCVKANIDACAINATLNLPILISSINSTSCKEFQIKTSPGNTVQISVQFGIDKRSDQTSSDNLELGRIINSRGTNHDIIKMTGNGSSNNSIFKSSSSITIKMNPSLSKWMLNITAHGCRDPELQNFTSVLNRKGVNVTIRCDLNGELWTLQCDENGRWIGANDKSCKRAASSNSSTGTGIILVSSVALATVLLITITCFILCKIKRNRIASAKEHNSKRNKSTEFVYKDEVDNRFSTTAHHHLEPHEIDHTAAAVVQPYFGPDPYHGRRIYDGNLQFHTMATMSSFAHQNKKENLPYSADCTCFTMKYPPHHHPYYYHHPSYANTGIPPDMTTDASIFHESPYDLLSHQPAYPIIYPSPHQTYGFNPYLGAMAKVTASYANNEMGPIYNTLEVISSPEVITGMTSHQIIDSNDRPTDLTMARAKLKLSREDIMAAEKAAWVEMR